MSSWLENGRPAILEALAAACDEVDERARAEIELRDRENKQLVEELHALRTRVAQVDCLQQENDFLQAEIRRLREIPDVQVAPMNKRVVLGELSPNKSTTAQSSTRGLHEAAARAPDPVKYKRAIARCKELETRYNSLRKHLEEHRIKLRERNECIEKWARYSDELHGKNERLRARLNSRSSGDGALKAQANEAGGFTTTDDDFFNIVEFKRPSSVSIFDHEPPSSPPLIPSSDANSAIPFPKRILSEPPPRLPIDDTFPRSDSDTATEASLPTIDDVGLPPNPEEPVEARLAAVKVELSSDPPIIVSSRSARKRKHGRKDPDDTRFRKVKSERNSSSGPEIIRESHRYSPAESIDFDEEVHVPTPRKRRTRPQFGYENTGTSSGGVPRVLLRGQVESSSTLDMSHTPAHGIVDTKPHKSSAPLNVSPQLKRTGRAVMKDSSIRPDVFTSNLALGVKDLAEDGDAEKGDASSNQSQRPVGKGRLDALLNSPSVQARPPINRDDPPRVHAPRPVPAQDGNIGANFSTASKYVFNGNTTPRDTRHSEMKQSLRASLSPKPGMSREKTPKKPSIVRDDMPRGRPIIREGMRLRERPIEQLRPEDFKPNPLYNDGLSFVYDEVVRGKDARAALSGCIDPKCCGKTFRHFAEAELKSLGSSAARRAEAVGLMERYLGDEAFKLGTMTREDREEAWLKAKTWELANKFGKHRQRYSRMPSPPGFWSMDFPNTQERAEELRQAEEIRKSLVIERHREAMRCKGSWLFRDEEPR